jgi:hypothetical protein
MTGQRDMSDNENDKPVDHIADCAESLYRIAEALEEISSILESCRSGRLNFGEDRHAIYTLPITD